MNDKQDNLPEIFDTSSKILIIGGYGGMGKLFAKLFSDLKFDVTITGPNEEKGKETAKNLGVKYLRDNSIAASQSDIIIISVPIEKTVSIIKEVGPKIKNNALITDLTSVKSEVCDALIKYTNKNSEIVSIHPMFGPRVREIHGQVFVLCPLRSSKYIKLIKNFLDMHKAKYIETTPEEHDKTMAVIQGLTHFTYIAIGNTLKNLNFNVKESRSLASPIYELMLDMIGRILGQDPYMYAHIQMDNPKTKEIREEFIKSVMELKKVVDERDEKKFVDIMSNAAKHFSDLQTAMGRSDKAINSLVSEIEFLKNAIGKEIFVKHIYSGNIHFGILNYVDAENIILSNKTSKKTEKIKISNINILNEAASLEEKKKIFGLVERDFSLVLDECIDENIILEFLNKEKYEKEIYEIKIKDIYQMNGKKSVCYGLNFINREIKEKEKETRNFLNRIGKLR